jgi:hypothetical protein
MREFTSIQNKGFLWDLLIEQNIFDGIDSSYQPNVKANFEKTINAIDGQNEYPTLIHKNKETVRKMVSIIQDYKQQINQSKQNNQGFSQQSQYKPQQMYSSSDIQQERQKSFDRELQRKQNELSSAINPKVPQSIDFSDKIEDVPLGNNIDDLIARTLAMREQQLNQVLVKQDTKAASEWINPNGNGNGNGKQIKITNEEPNIQNVSLDIDIVNLSSSDTKKQVSFNDSKNNIHHYEKEPTTHTVDEDAAFDPQSFLSKFKLQNQSDTIPDNKTNNNDSLDLIKINNKLDQIIAQQKKILDLLIHK